MEFFKKVVCASIVFLLLLCSQVFSQVAEVTRSGDTWTARVGNTVVYTGTNMTEAVNAACNGMTGGTINVRNSGVADVFWGMQPRANQTIDFHGNTIESVDNVIPIYADRRNGITIRNVHMTGGPRYGIWFRGSSNVHLHNIVMELSHSSAVGIGIRVDNHSDHRVPTGNLRVTGYVRIEGTRDHGFETYGIDGLEAERIITRNTGGCGVLLNDTRNAHIRYVNAYRANHGGGYAGFRTANNCGPNVVLDTLIATDCGRGFFSLTGSHGITVNYVEITGSTNIGIWIENVPNNRVLSGYVWNNRNNVSISGSNIQGSSVNVRNTPPPATPPPPPPAPNFTFAVAPTSGSVAAGSAAATVATITPQNGFTGSVAFSLVSPPSGVTLSGGPANVTGTSAVTSNLSVVVAAGTAAGSHNLTIRATSGALVRNVTFALTITAPPQPPPPPPPPAVTRVFRGNGNLFDSLYVYETANAQNWNVMTNMATGQNVYGDRAFTIETIPQGFEGSEWIQTAMNSRTVTNLSQYATIVARESGVIYIAHCDRVTTKPQWLSAYTQTDMAIIIRENATTTRRLTLFSREFSQGDTIAFGINSTTGTTTSSMYIPIVRALPVTNISQAEAEVKELAISVSPNPFNPATVISYALPTASFVELKIFNINGALVEELVSGNKGVGVHTVSFDGARLPSGVYFARMSANGKMLQKKMLLLK